MNWLPSGPNLSDSNSFSFRIWLNNLWNFIIHHTSVTAVSAAYTAKLSDSVILVDTSGGAITITLPIVLGTKQKTYTIKKSTNSANNITVATPGSETIDGSATSTVSGTSYESKKYISDGSNWWTI